MPKIENFIKIINSIYNWYDYLFDFWLKRDGIFKYRMKDGNIVLVRLGSDDRFIINEIYVHNVYTPADFFINKNDVVVDIGAHIGIFSLYASRKAKEGRILAFEPTPKNFAFLQRNIGLNNCKNISIFNSAVSDKTAPTTFYIREEKYSGRHSFIKPKEEAVAIKIITITLAEIMKKNNLKKINFLKLDCEGAEYNILYKAKKSVLQRIDKISMECHNIDKKRNAAALKYFLERNGFKVILPRADGETCLLFAMRNNL